MTVGGVRLGYKCGHYGVRFSKVARLAYRVLRRGDAGGVGHWHTSPPPTHNHLRDPASGAPIGPEVPQVQVKLAPSEHPMHGALEGVSHGCDSSALAGHACHVPPPQSQLHVVPLRVQSVYCEQGGFAGLELLPHSARTNSARSGAAFTRSRAASATHAPDRGPRRGARLPATPSGGATRRRSLPG
jgi:hypothetical protein